MTHTSREIEQPVQAAFEPWVALDLATKGRGRAVQELQLPSGALELTRVRIAPVHDGGALGHPPIAFGVVRHPRV